MSAEARPARGRAALITGGGGDLARAAAARLARDGFALALCDLDLERAQEAAAALPGSGHLALALDVTEEASVARAFGLTERALGPLAVLLCCAGGTFATLTHQPRLADTPVEDWIRTEALNARGSFLCVRELLRLRQMAPIEDGRIILVSSGAAHRPAVAAGAAYSCSKAAVIALGRSAALEAAPLGITVNVIAPGGFDTGAYRLTTSDEQRARQIAGVPLGRLGRPDEFGALVGFLASPEAGYVTGATFDINGGARMA
jgi:3-oxoacyl-[acyl-carrier protein] reductase